MSAPSISNAHFHRTATRRIAWITPGYPPDHGGVSDHSYALVSALRSAGHDVLVCSRPHERDLKLLDAELSAYAPDLVVVAYVPLGFAPHTGGIAPSFALWCVGLRKRLRCRAILLAHEASLPAAGLWQRRDFKLAALGAVQIAQFILLAGGFDSVLFSNMGTLQIWARGPSCLVNRFHTIRICSNIPYIASADPVADLAASGASVPSQTILFLGSGHESVLFDYVEEAFIELLEIEPNVCLVIVGMTLEKLRRLRPSLADLGARVQALGYVAATQVSLWLQVSTMVLAPLAEGVSARKGTVMAALQHGKTVVTTRGFHTRNDIAWEQICIVTPLDREAFAAISVKAFHDPEWRAAIGRAARAEYEEHASASATAAKILEYADHTPT